MIRPRVLHSSIASRWSRLATVRNSRQGLHRTDAHAGAMPDLRHHVTVRYQVRIGAGLQLVADSRRPRRRIGDHR